MAEQLDKYWKDEEQKKLYEGYEEWSRQKLVEAGYYDNDPDWADNLMKLLPKSK